MKIMRLAPKNYILITFILILGLILNIYLFSSLFLGLILGLFYIIFYSFLLGKTFFFKEKNFLKFIFGFLTLTTFIIILGTATYYVYALKNWLIILILFLIPLFIFLIAWQKGFKVFNEEYKGVRKIIKWYGEKINYQSIFVICYLLFVICSFVILFQHQTQEAIRSPWEVLPREFFIVYFLATLTLITYIFYQRQSVSSISVNQWSYPYPSLILITIHTFLSLSVALIIYKIGYGFDPFIHRAGEKVIFDQGVILPKPFYYIGQYSLVVILSKLFSINLSIVDKILVPLLAAIFLPTTIYYSFKKTFNLENKYLLISTCYLLFVICYLLFYTVPQNLANLFLLVIIFLAFLYVKNRQIPLSYLWFLGIACFYIHPLAGIPAFIFLGFLSFTRISQNLIRLLFILISLIIFPLIFWLSSKILHNFQISFQMPQVLKNFDFKIFYWLPFHSIYHLIYLYKFNLIFLFSAVTIIGSWYLLKNKYYLIFTAYFSLFTIILINIIFLQFFKFSSLIDYEQQEFTMRLAQIAILFLLPIFFSGIYQIIKKIVFLPKGRLLVILVTTTLITISFYLSYPRVDAFEKNKGFSVSQADLEVVHFIAQDVDDEDYVVLANQSTAAAALKEFGFKKYYQLPVYGYRLPVFYYPIPTSGPLYDLYLKMVYDEPKHDYMMKAMDLVGVEKSYFVINDYWLDFDKIVAKTKKIADSSIRISQGKIWVFVFNK